MIKYVLTLRKFRKLPISVEAIQFFVDPTNPIDLELNKRYWKIIEEFIGEKLKFKSIINSYYISTLEGDMVVTDGDYIIKGINGEFYPCKPDIFEKTYEEIDHEKEN